MSTKQAVTESKKLRKETEDFFVEKMTNSGFDVVKNGMPGFVCYGRDGRVIFVAVKISARHRFSKKQRKFMETITNSAKGTDIYCYRWSPDNDWIANV